MSYTCFTDFVHHRTLQSSGGTYFQRFTQSVFVIFQVSGVRPTGCHTLTVQLISWHGNGRDSEGKACDTILHSIFSGSSEGKYCDPYFLVCIDEKVP